ncbi:MAG: hypothetical protein KA712_08450 [Myxococcales bacterium]|nr:hypothetical protein [Myxococcales bacterium]
MRNASQYLRLLGLSVALATVSACGSESTLGTGGQALAVADLPPAVVAAAQAAVPGLVINEAEVEDEDDRGLEYELEGLAGGVAYEVEVEVDTAGNIVEVEVSRADKDDREDDDDRDDDGKKIPLADVPPAVLAAAAAALPGFVAEEVEVEVEDDGVTEYELEGTVSGVAHEVEIEVDGTGRILEVEVERDDDTDKDDDGQDDKDEDDDGKDDEDDKPETKESEGDDDSEE